MRRSLSCSCYLVWAAAECKHKYVASATLGRGSLYTYTSVRTRGVCSIRPVAAPCFPGPCDDPTVTTHVASGPTQTRPLPEWANSGTNGRGPGLGSEEAIFDPSCARAKQGRQASCPRGPRFACVALPADRFGRIPVPASLWVDLRSSLPQGLGDANHLPLEWTFLLFAYPSVQLSTAGRFGVMRQGSLLWSMAEGVHNKPQ